MNSEKKKFKVTMAIEKNEGEGTFSVNADGPSNRRNSLGTYETMTLAAIAMHELDVLFRIAGDCDVDFVDKLPAPQAHSFKWLYVVTMHYPGNDCQRLVRVFSNSYEAEEFAKARNLEQQLLKYAHLLNYGHPDDWVDQRYSVSSVVDMTHPQAKESSPQ